MRRCNTVNDKGEPVMFRRMLVLLDAGLVGRRVVPWGRRLLVPVPGDVRLLVLLPPGRTGTAGSRTLLDADQGEAAARDPVGVAPAGVAAQLRGGGRAVAAGGPLGGAA